MKKFFLILSAQLLVVSLCFGQDNGGKDHEVICRFIDIMSKDSFRVAEPSQELQFYCESGSFIEVARIEWKKRRYQVTELSNDTVSHLIIISDKGIRKSVDSTLYYASAVQRPKMCSEIDQEKSSMVFKGLYFSLDDIQYRWRLETVDENYHLIEVYRVVKRKRSTNYKHLYYMVLKSID